MGTLAGTSFGVPKNAWADSAVGMGSSLGFQVACDRWWLSTLPSLPRVSPQPSPPRLPPQSFSRLPRRLFNDEIGAVVGGAVVPVVALAVPKNPSGSLEDVAKGWPDQRDCWYPRPDCAVEYLLCMQNGQKVRPASLVISTNTGFMKLNLRIH